MRYLSEYFNLPLGTVVLCEADETMWVFIGYAETKSGGFVGDTAVFCRDVTGTPAGNAPWLYTASNPATLIKKFRDLAMYVRDPV
jgi:hypothetical protein